MPSTTRVNLLRGKLNPISIFLKMLSLCLFSVTTQQENEEASAGESDGDVQEGGETELEDEGEGEEEADDMDVEYVEETQVRESCF